MWVQYLALTIIAVTTLRVAIVRFPKTIRLVNDFSGTTSPGNSRSLLWRRSDR